MGSQVSNNLRMMYGRQQSSAQSHIDRIRGISSGASRNEEVMRLKNELAMQRLLRQQRKQAHARGQHYHRPSVHQLHEYSPMHKIEKIVGGSPQSDLPLPSERYVSQKRAQLVEQPKVPTSARNVVSMDLMNQIK